MDSTKNEFNEARKGASIKKEFNQAATKDKPDMEYEKLNYPSPKPSWITSSSRPKREKAEGKVRTQAEQRLAELKKLRAEEKTQETFNRTSGHEKDGGMEY